MKHTEATTPKKCHVTASIVLNTMMARRTAGSNFVSGFKIAICCKPVLYLTIAAVLKVTIYIKKEAGSKNLVFYPMFSAHHTNSGRMTLI